MDFSVITPSFRSLPWLPLCAASVADQTGVTVEHLVQDSCSDDGTGAWLKHRPHIKAGIEKDQGMYDAINRGLRRANGEILAQLNADEQYLPGALAAVRDCFATHPEVDIVLADTVVVNPSGEYLCSRKSALPRRGLFWVHNPTITSSIFFHRRVIAKHQLFFDPGWRIVGDVAWMLQALKMRLRMKVLRRYTSTFTETGDNLYFSPRTVAESERLRKHRPLWICATFPLLRWVSRFDRAWQGALWGRPAFGYALYTQSSPQQRREYFVPHPTSVWWNRRQRGDSAFSQKLRRICAGRSHSSVKA